MPKHAYLLLLFLVLPIAHGIDLEYFRAMYDQPWNKPSERYWSFEELGEIGFDAVYAPANAVTDHASARARWINGSLEADQNGLLYLCGPFYMSGLPPIEYEHAVDSGGHRDRRRPSPVDEEYWTMVMEDIALAIANLSLHYPISGVVWDTEP